MTTREEMAEACAASALEHFSTCLEAADAQLKRDGELRERLAKMAAGWRARRFPEKDCADEIEALLKEFP